MEVPYIIDIDQELKKLRQENEAVQRKEKIREEEYVRATKNYLTALKKETEAFEKNSTNYDRRNDSFKEEVRGMLERCAMGNFSLEKSGRRLMQERNKVNAFLLERYPKMAAQVKENLLQEKVEIEKRIEDLRQETLRKEEEAEKSGGKPDRLLGQLYDVRAKQAEFDSYLRDARKAEPTRIEYSYENNQEYLKNIMEKTSKYGGDFDQEALSYPRSHSQPRLIPNYLRDETKSTLDPDFHGLPRTNILSDFFFKVSDNVINPTNSTPNLHARLS